MSQHVNSNAHPRAALTAVAALAAAMLTACVTKSSQPLHMANQQEAAAANTQLGIQYMNQGDLNLAKTKLDRALEQDPSNPAVHSARAMMFTRMNQPAKADEEFRTALRLAPHDPEVINNYAVYLCQNGRTDEGVKRFLEAAHNALYRTPQAAYTNAGVCLRAAKRDDEARVNFNAAIQARPNYAEAAFQLAALDFDHGQLAAARTRIDGYVGTYDATPDLLLLGVRVARAQGDVLGAQRYARRLKLDYPGSDQARALAALEKSGT
ncbi:MAG TPA: type IV pilus biogenesis/stability protein PilW [Steroidobacteraceae bacterium]|nr:type IV pilus biogenesis/stability protein PilW [Steroidobacteraceae bacterium]